MAVPAYDGRSLARIATVIACAARLFKWSQPLGAKGGQSVQEVQCMRLGGTLYIAGNDDEDTRICAFLSAFGVADHASLMTCLSYSYAVLDMDHGVRKTTMGRGYDAKFGPTEQEAINFTAANAACIPPLTGDQLVEMRTLVKADTIAGLTPRQLRLAWCMKKLTGAGEVAGLDIPVASGLTRGNTYVAGREVTLINENTGVHAELKLMRLAVEACLAQKLSAAIELRIGGLKRACKFCDPWMARCTAWINLSLVSGSNIYRCKTRADKGAGPASAQPWRAWSALAKIRVPCSMVRPITRAMKSLLSGMTSGDGRERYRMTKARKNEALGDVQIVVFMKVRNA